MTENLYDKTAKKGTRNTANTHNRHIYNKSITGNKQTKTANHKDSNITNTEQLRE